MVAPLPPNEADRLRAMWRYIRHNQAPDAVLDAITRSAAKFFDVPIVLVSLVEENSQWFKSQVGLDISSTPRDVSFCAYAILENELLEVADATVDARFQDNPLVTGPPYIRYYLGAPLVTPDGFSIGTLCLIDYRQRVISDEHKRHLQVLAHQIMSHLELQRLQRLEQLINHAGLGIWELDVSSNAMWGNDEFQRLHGAAPLTPGHRLELASHYLPEDRDTLESGLERIVQQGIPFDGCLRLKAPGETAVTWVHVTGASIEDRVPARHIIGTLQDITPLQQSRHELEWRHRIDDLITRLQASIIAGDNISASFSDALEALRSLTESEYGFIGEVFKDKNGEPFLKTHAVTDISWDEASRALYCKAQADGLVFSQLDSLYGHVLRTGEPLISNRPSHDPRRGGLPKGHPSLDTLLCLPVSVEGEMVAMLGLANCAEGYSEGTLVSLEPLLRPLGQLIHGLRLRRQHDEAWQRLELSSKVFSSSREAIMISDGDNRIIEVNEAFERITGYTRDEVLGKNPRVLSSGRQTPAFYRALWASLNKKGYWQGEVLNRRKNGDPLPEMLSISVVRNEAGETSHYVAVFSDLTHIKQHADELFRAGHVDRLTALPNRSHMIELMHEALDSCKPDETLAIAVLDLDGFHELNSRFGRAGADRILLALAGQLVDALGSGDLIARIGGDEFAFLLRRFEGSLERLEFILQQVAKPLRIPEIGITDEAPLRLTGSLGVTLFPTDHSDSDTLLRHADQAMYRAKMVGGNRFVLFNPEREQELKDLQMWRGQIARALDAGEFVLFYQPQFDPVIQKVTGVEALIRWQHPERGLLAPDQFLPAIAGSELELSFDAWVLETALQQMEEWHASAIMLEVCINLSPQSLTRADFFDTLQNALAAHPGVSPALLCLEVLESAALDDLQAATQVMRACRSLGVNVALDDFGTGYSSLTYLRDLPVDMVKVDRSFVINMLEREHDLAIVESVVYLAKRFNKKVVAEGVESNAHVKRLTQMGCHLLQGFGIARPMPAKALQTWYEHPLKMLKVLNLS
ncbi:sensor domain-containing phosphodiesterase [Vreelandella alkaliphila]|uniref:EAL domain-containing protein n=1 Tax=Vreelandella alkaliphila TaxID=272774 RepID=A0A7C9K459_9GAMM|nr:EAL domain-containing protein [Halomonas alkaliphila]NDL69041.1 EAL domain-containing protein [Halomonas alkaliphila]